MDGRRISQLRIHGQDDDYVRAHRCDHDNNEFAAAREGDWRATGAHSSIAVSGIRNVHRRFGADHGRADCTLHDILVGPKCHLA